MRRIVFTILVALWPILASGQVTNLTPSNNGAFISVMSVGARGDGVSDDTAAINSAISAALTAGANTVVFGPGTYRITGAIVCEPHVLLYGYGATINIDYDGPAFVGGKALGAGNTYISIEGFVINGISPETRPSQTGIEWISVYTPSFIRDVTIANVGNEGIHIEKSNAITIENDWVNGVYGNNCLYIKDSSSIIVIGGAYEGPQWNGGTGYGPGGKSINVSNTVYGDYSPRFYGVQTERGAYGYYISMAQGVVIDGATSHFGGTTQIAAVYLDKTTYATEIVSLNAGEYTNVLIDALNNVTITAGQLAGLTSGGCPLEHYSQSSYVYAPQGINFGGSVFSYSSGTWTPTFTADTPPTVVYSVQVGTYVKLGKMVMASARVVASTVKGGSGHVYIGGLPFAARSISNFLGWSSSVGFSSSWRTHAPTRCVVETGGTLVLLFYDDTGGGNAAILTGNLANNSEIDITVVYEASN